MSTGSNAEGTLGEAGDLAEIIAAIRACSLGVTTCRPATFRPAPGTDVHRAFEGWINAGFRTVHAPHFVRVSAACRDGGAREVAALDRDYGGRIAGCDDTDPLVHNSRDAGRNVLDALTGARHVRLLDQLRAAVGRGEMPGHFTTLLACQAAVFHVAPAHGLMALAFLEWKFAGGHLSPASPAVAQEVAFARAAMDAGLPAIVSSVLRDERPEAETLFACA